jgi:tetratricopeptide (TPR) repeat protein
MKARIDFKKYEEKIDKEGLVWEEKEEFEKAITAYDRFLTEIEVLSPGNRHEEEEKNAITAYLLMRKAAVLLQTGKLELGERLMFEAAQHAEESRKSLAVTRAKIGIGVLYGSTGRLDEGEKFLKAALLSFGKGTDYDSKQGCGWALLNLGGLYNKQGKLIQAEQKLCEAIRILESIENWVGVASAYELKAKVSNAKKDHEQAKQDLINAVSFYEKQGMKEKANSLREETTKRD